MGGKKYLISKLEDDCGSDEKDNWFDIDTTKEICLTVWSTYCRETPKQLKIIDVYLLYIMATGAIQLLYAFIVGSFPFNAILAGFISCVGSFVLGVGLRLQVNQENNEDFNGISKERAFADFIFAHVVLHLVVINFIG